MSKRLLKTMVALLAIAAAAAGPAWGQNSTTYNVTFSGFNYPELNTTVNVASLPQTFTSNFNPPSVVSDECYTFTNATVTSGGEGKVSASVIASTEMSITVNGTFEGTATIRVTAKDDEEVDVSTDITVACVAVAPAPEPEPEPTKYTSAVAMSALQVGDTLAEGFSLTGEDANTIYFVENRHKNNENLSGSLESINLEWIQSIGANCVFSTLAYNEVFTTFAPVDENGRDGDAWVVTEVESIAGFTNITIAGISVNPPVPHTVRFAAGNEGWTVTDVDSARSATAPAVLQNVMAGDSLVVTAPATLDGKVKSVKAVKYVPPAATVTTAPTATGAIIEANTTAALVNAGAANGGTMMYAVTTTNTKPTSTDGFSATVPTAEGRTAGTYYVWYYAKADADHSDSEIAGPVSVTLPVITTVTWNSSNVLNIAHQDDMLKKNYTTPLTYEDITISFSGTDVSSFYPYSTSRECPALTCYGDDGDSFTFTAPSGKMFCKIEIIDNSYMNFDAYGDWTKPENNKIVWRGTAANAVTLGTVFAEAAHLNSIVFKMIEAQ